MLSRAITEYYERGAEHERLEKAPAGPLEFLRTQALLERFLPAPPAAVIDVGGGAGIHAVPLAERGYEVHLVDPVPLHVEQAADRGLAGAVVADARRLPFENARFDAALLLGPLYHLQERADRVAALAEARRVVRPGGFVAAAAISRFASTFDGLVKGYLDQEGFEALVEQDLRDGRHDNPENRPGWFTTAYFHLPEELPGELEDAGLASEGVLAVGSRSSVSHHDRSTSSLRRTVAASPNRLHASACRATSRSVRRSPEPPTRIGMRSCSGRG